jgi:hypothetical protein
MTASIVVEPLFVEPSPGQDFILVEKICTSPAACCGAVSTCFPPGYSALEVEQTTYDMPPGARLEREWCELVDVCCVGSGSGSGSGQCMTCCADVYPYYVHSTDCCNTPMPDFGIISTFSGDCAELNKANWSPQLFSVSNLPGFPNGCWIAGNAATDPHVLGLILNCEKGQLKLNVYCGGSSSTDPPWFTIPLTVDSCCPFAAHGTATAPPSACCAGGTVTVNLFAPAGERGDGSGSGSGTGNCVFLVKFQEWSFPKGTTVTDPGCETDPDCCERTITSCCGKRQVPAEIHLAIGNIRFQSGSGGLCPFKSNYLLTLYRNDPFNGFFGLPGGGDLNNAVSWIGVLDLTTPEVPCPPVRTCALWVHAYCTIDSDDQTEYWRIDFAPISYSWSGPNCTGARHIRALGTVNEFSFVRGIPCDSSPLFVEFPDLRLEPNVNVEECCGMAPVTFDAILLE